MPKVSNVYQDKKSKRWYFVANLGYDHEGKRIRHWERGFMSQKDAKIAYSKYMNDFSDSAVKMNSTMSYKEFFYSYFLPDYKNSVEKSTFDSWINSAELHYQYFFNTKLKDITAPMLKKWQNELLQEYSNSYVHKIYFVFKQSLDLAVQLGFLKENSARKICNIKLKQKEVNFWTLDEFKKVISCIDYSIYSEFFWFIFIWTMFMTGIRIGEANALMWSDLDFEKHELHINKSMYCKNRHNYFIKSTKTKSGVRTISIDEKTIMYLKEWEKLQSSRIKTKFILTPDGLPLDNKKTSDNIEKYSKKADVHKIKVHALRHSHAALLISMGESALAVKDRLGHANIETTLSYYGHLYPNVNKQIANKLKSII